MQNNESNQPTEMERANVGRDYSVYIWRMDAASEAKVMSLFSRFHEIFDGMKIVDMGSGTGLVAEKIAEKCRKLGFSVEVFAVDVSHEFYDASSDQPLIQLIFGDASTAVLPDNSVDCIYFSTSGHEIESFCGRGKMKVAVTRAFNALRSDGQLIIRDFVKPNIPGPILMEIPRDDGVSVDLETPSEKIDYNQLSTYAKFLRFHHEFAGGGAFTFTECMIAGKQLIQIDAEWAYEFYMRKEYTGNWRNEIKEKYSYWTLQEANEVLAATGFTEITVEEDSSEFMLNNWLRGKIGLFQLADDKTLNVIDFPPTHMIISGRKPTSEATNEITATQPNSVDFQELIDSIEVDEANGVIRFHPSTSIAIEPKPVAVGTKFTLYKLRDNSQQVIKIPNRNYFNSLRYSQQVNQFKALLQTVERQSILEQFQTPHLAVTAIDPEGPPYRFLIQEALPEGSTCAADLILSGNLAEEDIRQFCEIINQYETNKTYQLDSNPFAWYRVPQPDGSFQLTYLSGKVYSYHDNWKFSQIGLLQWTDNNYLENASYYSAAIPKKNEQLHFAHEWYASSDAFSIWKKYLEPSIWPAYT